MAKRPPEGSRDGPLEQPEQRYDNLEDYVRGFLAAIRTHQRLSGDDDLQVTIDHEGGLPLAQRIMLR